MGTSWNLLLGLLFFNFGLKGNDSLSDDFLLFFTGFYSLFIFYFLFQFSQELIAKLFRLFLEFLTYLFGIVHSLNSLQEFFLTLVNCFSWIFEWSRIFRELFALQIQRKLFVEVSLFCCRKLLIYLGDFSNFSFKTLKFPHELLFLFSDLIVFLLGFFLKISIKTSHFLFDLFLSCFKSLVLDFHFFAFFVESYDFLLDFAKWFFHIVLNFLSLLGFLFDGWLYSLLNFLNSLLNFFNWEAQSLFIFNSEKSFLVHLIKKWILLYLSDFIFSYASSIPFVIFSRAIILGAIWVR